jgi:hypothetical protein
MHWAIDTSILSVSPKGAFLYLALFFLYTINAIEATKDRDQVSATGRPPLRVLIDLI